MTAAIDILADPALSVALALVAGVLAQAIAHHVRLPGIVLLLAVGVALGPDGFGIIQPQHLGSTLRTLVGFAMAVILFEGGMNLRLSRLRRVRGALRRLITVGTLITAVGGAITARLLMDWNWSKAVLFGTLVIVTGPTVIQPLVRRIRLKTRVATVLEGEGVLIDPIGAIIATVTLEVILHPTGPSFALGSLDLLMRLGVGAAIGVVAGFLISWALRPRHLVPDQMVNVFALTSVLAVFHLANLVQHEVGIGAVTVAGLVVGNFCRRVLRDLMEFKEQLTVMFIGMLFVLLAADIRLSEIGALGWSGVLTVVVLMVVVRPLNVAVSTVGSNMNWRERLFMAWLAPRGIVAAAVASFFAVALDEAGIPGGSELRAMTFLVIAITVTVQGISGGWLASWLGLKPEAGRGFVILGAGHLGRALARALREADETVVFVDSNADAANAAQADGFQVAFGNALEERTLSQARAGEMATGIGLTPNEEVNLMFAERCRREHRMETTLVALNKGIGHISPDMATEAGARVLFASHRDIGLWSVRLRRDQAAVERWHFGDESSPGMAEMEPQQLNLNQLILPLVVYRKGRARPVDDQTVLRKGDEAALVLDRAKHNEAAAHLRKLGWVPVEVEKELSSPAD